MKGQRERYEFTDMVLIKQHDQMRTVQISRAANTYLLVPDVASVSASPTALPAGAPPPRAAGIVMVTTSIVDTGERKQAFGREARRVKTTMDRQPMAGACDAAKQHMETDGWYIDAPIWLTTPPSADPTVPIAGDCNDEIKATQNGDPRMLGFPISYAMTVNGDDGNPNVVTMNISELETATLDAALFETPVGFTVAGDLKGLSKALSDADEATLAGANPVTAPKIPGVVRVGVPELTNSSGQDVDTRALRTQMIAALVAVQIQAEPLAAGSQAELLTRVSERGYDYLLVADVTEMKVPKSGGLGGALRTATRVATAGAGGPPKDPTEATIAMKLIQLDGKTRLSTTKKGKNGGGLDMKTAVGVAKFASSLYVNMLTGRTMLGALNSLTTRNLGGMGMLGNPALMTLQTRGLGMGKGVDPTAGAASFLMQQAMRADMAASGATPAQGGTPSFDEALGDAVGDTAKAVAENLKKKK